MVYKAQDIEKKLQKKFNFKRTSRQDHREYELELPGAPPIRTIFSHNKQEIGPTLESLIARQLGVSTRDFRGMIDCTVGKDDYYSRLKAPPTVPYKRR